MAKMICILLVLAVFGGMLVAGETPALAAFHERIKAQDPRLYRKVRDAPDWKNPFLVARAGGIVINLYSKAVAADKLVSMLIGLPESAWPYGRVVALSEIAIQDGESAPRIGRHFNEAKKALETAGIDVVIWPSN